MSAPRFQSWNEMLNACAARGRLSSAICAGDRESTRSPVSSRSKADCVAARANDRNSAHCSASEPIHDVFHHAALREPAPGHSAPAECANPKHKEFARTPEAFVLQASVLALTEDSQITKMVRVC